MPPDSGCVAWGAEGEIQGHVQLQQLLHLRTARFHFPLRVVGQQPVLAEGECPALPGVTATKHEPGVRAPPASCLASCAWGIGNAMVGLSAFLQPTFLPGPPFSFWGIAGVSVICLNRCNAWSSPATCTCVHCLQQKFFTFLASGWPPPVVSSTATGFSLFLWSRVGSWERGQDSCVHSPRL